GLLLGPVFTHSKAYAAINLARRHDAPERPVVPVFWLASQDHDGAEIDHAYLLDASESLKRVSVALPEGVPAGRIPMAPEYLDAALAAIAAMTPEARCREMVTRLLQRTAEQSGSFADWFAAQMYALLGETGLVLVDPLQPDVAPLFGRVLRREIDEPTVTPAAINDSGRALRDLGHEPQLGRGADATNMFVELRDGDLPKRVLLRFDGRTFTAEGRRFTRAELLQMLDDDPTVITPAAGLRPVTQDELLPTAVFVLGPGELKYVAQLGGVYRFHDVAMPLAWPRAQVSVVEPAAARLLDGFSLSAAEFKQRGAAVLEEMLLDQHGHAGRFNKAAGEVESLFEELLTEVSGIDPTLKGTVTRGHRHLAITIDKLRAKSAAALARRDSELKRQVERLAAHVLPLGQDAERLLSPYSHILKFGARPLLDRFAAMEPSGRQELRL
ncbi:MAG TPA: bacillithiol biosynthesis cysteine-adding enzyme BshC, partial [Trueperaceae bacterium]|nr:bacillithiol biosynthesis cysteine-adding enzyme BshC [Trueperaceae bacterium]